MGSGAEVAALLAMLGPLESKLSQLERSSLTRLRRIKKLGIAAFVSWLLSSWIMMSVLRAKREMREVRSEHISISGDDGERNTRATSVSTFVEQKNF